MTLTAERRKFIRERCGDCTHYHACRDKCLYKKPAPYPRVMTLTECPKGRWGDDKLKG